MKVKYSNAQLYILAVKLKEFNPFPFRDQTVEEVKKEILGFAKDAIQGCGGPDYFHTPGIAVIGGTGGYMVMITKEYHPITEEFYLDLQCYIAPQILFLPELKDSNIANGQSEFEVQDSSGN